MIDWSNPTDKISNHFTVKEALWLPQWSCMHIPSEEEQQNIVELAQKMDKVRDLLGKPINVHVWIRPVLNNPNSEHHGEDYNALVKGALHSAHKIGKAVDWDCGEDCDLTREQLVPMLEEWNLRMERNPNGNWVHLGNDWEEGKTRYFLP